MEESPRHFPEIQLTFVESRVLGCLLEKESTTPAYYPLTLNSLQAACNQTSNRQSVTQLEERLIEKALFGLREKGLVLKVNAAGSRSPKYKHILDQILDLDPAQRATLTVLLLRGVQTSGEIKQRCERMHEFKSLEEVDQALEWFIDYPHGPLVVRNPAGGGRRVETCAHLLCGAVPENARALPEAAAEVIELEEEQLWRSRMEQNIQGLQSQVEELSGMVHHLLSELGSE